MAISEVQLSLDALDIELSPVSPKSPCALCFQCPYVDQPCVPSDGPKIAELAIIGMAPHTQEVRKGLPFIGPSGKLLDAALNNAEIAREDVLITNLVLCKPLRSTDPDVKAIECCLPRLRFELESAKVKRVMTMGKTPRDHILPQQASKGIGTTRGIWTYSNVLDMEVLPALHPAFVLRGAASAFADVLADVSKFGQPIVRVPEVEYEVLTTHDELEVLLDTLNGYGGQIVIDLETSNINMKDSTPNEWWNGYILCLSICWRPGHASVISEQLFNSYKTLTMLRPFLEREEGFVGHNLKFDVLYLLRYYKGDLAIKIADDTLLMHYVLDERRGTHGLTSELTGFYFNEPDYDDILKSYLKKPKKDSYALVPRKVLYKYGAKDVDYTFRLIDIFVNELEGQNLYEYPYCIVLSTVVQSLLLAERRGLFLYESDLQYARDVLGDEVMNLKEELKDISGNRSLNPNSPKQVSKVIFQDLRLRQPKGRKIKVGSTNKETLLKLAGKHPFIDKLMRYRRTNKLLTTYANKINNYCDQDGQTHFSFNLAGAVTGRLEAGLLLTIPRSYTEEGRLIRNCFGARPGYVLVAADFSQAELRWLGWYSSEEFLYQVYEDDRDLHTEVAVAMYGPDFTKEQRMHTKMFNFSYAYGGSEHSFAEDAGLPLSMAREWVRKYDKNMPSAAIWKASIIERVKTNGYLTTPLGRRRRFPLITAQTFHEIRNQATNFPVQSVSSDTTLIAFHRLTEEFIAEKIDAHPVLFLHDGLYFECLDEPTVIKHVAQREQEVMLEVAYEIQANAHNISGDFSNLKTMPFKVDVSVGERWGSMKDLDM